MEMRWLNMNGKAQAKNEVDFEMRGWDHKVNRIMFRVVFTAEDCILQQELKMS